jgi:hypothetical protein
VKLNHTKFVLTLAAATLGSSLAAGCGGDSTGPLDGIDSIVFVQRPRRNEMGDIFQYTSYMPGAHISKLSPPTADGELTFVCCDQDPAFDQADISGYDISFDAREIVFAAKLSAETNYGLFVLTLDDGAINQIPSDPNRDYVQPIFLPGGKILFMTNAVVEEGAQQHQDEYERGTTLQLGTINRDGTDEIRGARNLSHRVHPTLLSDGRVMFTQWDHLGDENSGHLMIVNPDLTTAREGFGKEGTGVSNSYLKAVEIAPGRILTIATARDRTIQAGALLDVRLGQDDGRGGFTTDMSEANASSRLLTPNVPLDRDPSFTSVGRYYDAYGLNAAEYPDLLVSWADGAVESGTLGAAGTTADFGIYLYNAKRNSREPIWNDELMWDVFPRPLVARNAPPVIESNGANQFNPDATLVGSMNVYVSSLGDAQFDAGSVYGVRVIEGFSVEEGIPDDFGLTEHEGAADLGIAPVFSDGSWAALIPANVPVHFQPIDVFGMSLKSEPVWISGAAGESRFCGGCHESRTDTTVIQPGVTQAVAVGPTDLHATTPRGSRKSTTFTRDGAIGIPWDTALQPIFTNSCAMSGCHDGTPGAANPQWSIMDPVTGESFTWTFNLTGSAANYGVGAEMFSGYSASHLSLMGPMMRDLEDSGLVITGNLKIYVEPGNARGSELITKLNPPQQFPSQDLGNRAFGSGVAAHAAAMGHELTADEYYMLVQMADNGGQFYARENAPN